MNRKELNVITLIYLYRKKEIEYKCHKIESFSIHV